MQREVKVFLSGLAGLKCDGTCIFDPPETHRQTVSHILLKGKPLPENGIDHTKPIGDRLQFAHAKEAIAFEAGNLYNAQPASDCLQVNGCIDLKSIECLESQ